MVLAPGLAATLHHVVEPADTAAAVGSGDLPVLATPRLLALAEQATVVTLREQLPAEESSVGSRVELDHLHPSLVGTALTVRATLRRVDGRRLTFEVVVLDADQEVAALRVTRIVVDRARFLSRLDGQASDPAGTP